MLIKRMVEIYSPTGSVEGMVDFLMTWANQNGFHAYKDRVGNFVAERGEGKEILLVGHADTVAGEIPVRMEGKRLYGRGSVDAKGALACFLEASSAIEKGRLIIVGTIDEEGESRGARYLLGKFNPDFIVVGEPSGWSNLNMGYKGNINLFFTHEKGREHGSSPNPNCIEDAMAFIDGMRQFCYSCNREKTLFAQVGMRVRSINSGEDGFRERIEMRINFRTPIGLDLNELVDFADRIKGRAFVRYSGYEESVKVAKNNRLVSAFMKAIRSRGGRVAFKLKSGTSDMNILQKFHVPMVTYGPGDSSLDHAPDEYLDLEEYEKAVSVLKTVLGELVN